MHAGGCHCGNLRYELTSALPLGALPLRACQCTFCRRHGAVSTSDPLGRLRFDASDRDRVVHYRFGFRTADFLICGVCGVYVGAVIRAPDGAWGIVNANTLDDAGRLAHAVTPMDYGGEDAASRQARRRARWTPLAD